ncbi:hypothetical protein BIV59_06655 [Bacillus sp. MUM 13]|nr:hypothetical protein BIV59_06655 [Bacillus sp. MUM 13]
MGWRLHLPPRGKQAFFIGNQPSWSIAAKFTKTAKKKESLLVCLFFKNFLRKSFKPFQTLPQS